MDKQFEQWLRDLDVDAVLAATPRERHPPGGMNLTGQYHNTRTVVLASMHKVRVNSEVFSPAERKVSRRWLLTNGYTYEV